MAIDWQLERSGQEKAIAEANRCQIQAQECHAKAAAHPPGQNREDYLAQARLWEDMQQRNLAKAAEHQRQIELAREEMIREVRARDEALQRSRDDDLGHTR